MWNIVSGVQTGLTVRQLYRSVQKSKKNTLVQWSEASSSDRPAIIFVPGFLSAESEADVEAWSSEIMNVAEMYDFASYGLHWPSGTLWDLLLGKQWTTTLGAFAAPRVLGVMGAALINPILFAPALGIGIPTLWRALSTWKEAISNSDVVGENVHKWLGLIDRPVILVGHSLGARIVLRAAQNSRRYNVLQAFALAPAVLEEDCSFNKVHAHLEEKSAIFYSEHDFTLNYLFRAGEMTLKPPIGYTGVTQKKFRTKIQSIETSVMGGKKIGHNDYHHVLSELMHDHRLETPIDFWV